MLSLCRSYVIKSRIKKKQTRCKDALHRLQDTVQQYGVSDGLIWLKYRTDNTRHPCEGLSKRASVMQ